MRHEKTFSYYSYIKTRAVHLVQLFRGVARNRTFPYQYRSAVFQHVLYPASCDTPLFLLAAAGAFLVFHSGNNDAPFAEESRSGSLETLMTLPVSSAQAVAGKYLAAFISCAVMLLPTLSYAFTAGMFGSPDAGPIVGGYLGALFLAAAYSAIGLFASASSKNQIVAFFIGFAICIILSIIDSFLILLPAGITNFLSFFSANTHFESISKGIIDSRDLLYFISITIIFLGLTVKTEEGRRAA